MMRIRYLPLFFISTLLFTAIITFLWPHSTSASIDLYGDAVWFYRSCHDNQLNPVAIWEVGLASSQNDQKSVFVNVENAYPGYQLTCDLHFANSGDLRLAVKEVTVLNSTPQSLDVKAGEDPSEDGKVLKPCGFTPGWATRPTNVPANCRSEILLVLTIGQQAEENSRFNFEVQVRLEEKAR